MWHVPTLPDLPSLIPSRLSAVDFRGGGAYPPKNKLIRESLLSRSHRTGLLSPRRLIMWFPVQKPNLGGRQVIEICQGLAVKFSYIPGKE